jgi:hypothetical protein
MTNQAERFVQVGTLFFHMVELLFEPRRHPGNLCYQISRVLAGCDVVDVLGWNTSYERVTIEKSVEVVTLGD